MVFDKDGKPILNEDGTPIGSVDVNYLPAPDEGEDLNSLSKAELVERVEAAGGKTSGLNKAELVAILDADVAEVPETGEEN